MTARGEGKRGEKKRGRSSGGSAPLSFGEGQGVRSPQKKGSIFSY
jgi:hypothetical protein